MSMGMTTTGQVQAWRAAHEDDSTELHGVCVFEVVSILGTPKSQQSPLLPWPTAPWSLFPTNAASSQTRATSLCLWSAILTHAPPTPPLLSGCSSPCHTIPHHQGRPHWPHSATCLSSCCPALWAQDLPIPTGLLLFFLSHWISLNTLVQSWGATRHPPHSAFRNLPQLLALADPQPPLAHTHPSLGLPSARSQLSAWGVHSGNSRLLPERTHTRAYTHTRSPWPLCLLHVLSLRYVPLGRAHGGHKVLARCVLWLPILHFGWRLRPAC